MLWTLLRISLSTPYSTFKLPYEVLSRLHCLKNLVSKLYHVLLFDFLFNYYICGVYGCRDIKIGHSAFRTILKRHFN